MIFSLSIKMFNKLIFLSFVSKYVYANILGSWMGMNGNVSLGDDSFEGICGYYSNIIYAVHGRCKGTQLDSYNFETSIWNSVPKTYSVTVGGQSYDEYNNVIYYWDTCDPGTSNEIYDFILSNQWRRKKSHLPINIDEDPCLAIDKSIGYLYVIGGQINKVQTGITQIFSFDLDIWMDVNISLNIPRSRLSCRWSELNDNIYAIGGDKGISQPTNVIEIYNKTNGSWIISSTEMIHKRRDHSIIFGEGIYNHILFIIGGFGLKTTEIYNIVSNEIIQGPSFVHQKTLPCLVIINDTLYVIGSDPDYSWFASNISTLSPTIYVPTEYETNSPSIFPNILPTIPIKGDNASDRDNNGKGNGVIIVMVILSIIFILCSCVIYIFRKRILINLKDSINSINIARQDKSVEQSLMYSGAFGNSENHVTLKKPNNIELNGEINKSELYQIVVAYKNTIKVVGFSDYNSLLMAISEKFNIDNINSLEYETQLTNDNILISIDNDDDLTQCLKQNNIKIIVNLSENCNNNDNNDAKNDDEFDNYSEGFNTTTWTPQTKETNQDGNV